MGKLEKVIRLTSDKADQLILGGDLNLVQSKWDIQGGIGKLHTECIEAVQKCMGKYNLVDIYRENNRKKTLTTYTQFGVSKEEKRRRLDYIYVSESIKRATRVTANKTITNTDHNLVKIEINDNDYRKRNCGLWRHNNLLNSNIVFVEGLKEMIKNINYETLEGKQAEWEYTKFKIGQFSREFSRKKAKKSRE